MFYIEQPPLKIHVPLTAVAAELKSAVSQQ